MGREREAAAKEIIRLKKAYDHGGDHDLNMRNARTAEELRSKHGLEKEFGSGVSLADSLTNYHNLFGGGAVSQRPQPRQESSYSPVVQPQGSGRYDEPMPESSYDSDAMRSQMEDFYRGSAEGSYEAQKAQLDAMLQQQLQELEMAYNQAVQDGEMSVRDAERDFEAQKKEIEKSAYLQSQATKAHGNQMGIAHSQQMVGLQQGDSARVNEISNQNMTNRDNRVADIKTRLNTIRKEKGIHTAGATAQHGFGLASAQAQASQMYNQGMAEFNQQDFFNQQQMEHARGMQRSQFGHDDYMQQGGFAHAHGMQQNQFGQDDYMQDKQFGHSDRQLDRQLDHSDYQLDKKLGHEFDMESFRNTNNIAMALMNQGFNIDNMNLSQMQELERMDVSNKYVVENMFAQHGYNLEETEQNILGQLRTIDRSAGHTAERDRQARKARASEMAAEIRRQQEQDDKNMRNLMSSFEDKDSDYYKLRVYQQEEQDRQNMQGLVGGMLADYTVGGMMEDLNYEGSRPKDYRDSLGTAQRGNKPLYNKNANRPPILGPGEFMNKFTGFDKNTKSYEEGTRKQREAEKKLESMMRRTGFGF